jgi:hypothetical protein
LPFGLNGRRGEFPPTWVGQGELTGGSFGQNEAKAGFFLGGCFDLELDHVLPPLGREGNGRRPGDRAPAVGHWELNRLTRGPAPRARQPIAAGLEFARGGEGVFAGGTRSKSSPAAEHAAAGRPVRADPFLHVLGSRFEGPVAPRVDAFVLGPGVAAGEGFDVGERWRLNGEEFRRDPIGKAGSKSRAVERDVFNAASGGFWPMPINPGGCQPPRKSFVVAKRILGPMPPSRSRIARARPAGCARASK